MSSRAARRREAVRARHAREQAHRQAADEAAVVALRMGGMAAVYTLVQARGITVACPLHLGSHESKHFHACFACDVDGMIRPYLARERLAWERPHEKTWTWHPR